MPPVLNLDHDLASVDHDIGGKARNLARLRAAGLPCPRGIVITASDLSLQGPPDELLAALGNLRPPFAVRSSASIEDSAAGAAPGLFLSILGVSREAVAEAVARVADSKRHPSVKTYCLLRGIDEEAIRLAVVVQEQITAIRYAGVLYTRPPGRPKADNVVIDISVGACGPWSAVLSRHGDGGIPPIPAESWRKLLAAAARAETVIEARAGADIEWVIDEHDEPWLVQARPIIHPREAHSPHPRLFEFSLDDDRTWSWDVTHNPDPLSPAQGGLVARVGAASGLPMKVVGGYLYTAPEASPTPPVSLPPTAGALTSFFTDNIVPAVDEILGAAESQPRPALLEVLPLYDRVVTLYGNTVAPTLRAARQPLVEFLSERLGGDVTSALAALVATRSDRHLAARIRRVARSQETMDSLLTYAAPMAPAWDVAAPTFAEDPSPILDAIEVERQRVGPRPDDTAEASAVAARVRARVDEADRLELDRLVARAREAHELGETDDHIFFRAQALVRRALLAVAETWTLDQSSIFFLPLAFIEEHLARTSIPPRPRLEAMIESAKSERERQASTRMPLTFSGGRPREDAAYRIGAAAFRGIACGGGRARGPVVRVRDLGSIAAPVAGRVVLARALSPSLIFRVNGAAALVSAFGGPLGHGAAMARELGLPCVVGCPAAWEAVDEGDEVWVDGDSGLVVRARPTS